MNEEKGRYCEENSGFMRKCGGDRKPDELCGRVRCCERQQDIQRIVCMADKTTASSSAYLDCKEDSHPAG